MERNPDVAIEVRGLTKSFGGDEVLRGVDLSVPRGETYAFLGRNGAGKTTIRMMLGLLAPGTGTLSVAGLDPTRSSSTIRPWASTRSCARSSCAT